MTMSCLSMGLVKTSASCLLSCRNTVSTSIWPISSRGMRTQIDALWSVMRGASDHLLTLLARVGRRDLKRP